MTSKRARREPVLAARYISKDIWILIISCLTYTEHAISRRISKTAQLACSDKRFWTPSVTARGREILGYTANGAAFKPARLSIDVVAFKAIKTSLALPPPPFGLFVRSLQFFESVSDGITAKRLARTFPAVEHVVSDNGAEPGQWHFFSDIPAFRALISLEAIGYKLVLGTSHAAEMVSPSLRELRLEQCEFRNYYDNFFRDFTATGAGRQLEVLGIPKSTMADDGSAQCLP